MQKYLFPFLSVFHFAVKGLWQWHSLAVNVSFICLVSCRSIAIFRVHLVRRRPLPPCRSPQIEAEYTELSRETEMAGFRRSCFIPNCPYVKRHVLKVTAIICCIVCLCSVRVKVSLYRTKHYLLLSSTFFITPYNYLLTEHSRCFDIWIGL